VGIGELDLDEVEQYPAFNPNWLIEEKFFAFKKWLLNNFQSASEFYFDFSDFENEDELEEDEGLQPLDTRELLKMVWGIHLDAFEFEAVAALVDKELGVEWRPADHRISVEETVEDDEELEATLENIKFLVPYMRKHLSEMAAVVPEQMGHNAPPEMYAFTLEEIHRLEKQLTIIEALPDDIDIKGSEQLKVVAEQALKLAAGASRYAASKGDIFVSNFLESAGTTSGKIAVTGLAIYLAGNGLQQFADVIIRAISGN